MTTDTVNRYRHRPGLLPGAVVSAVSYESRGIDPGEHRGLPSPWITFIVSVDGPVRTMGTVADDGPFDTTRATAYDVIVAGLHPVAARVEQPADQSGVQLAVHPLAARAVLGCRAAELQGQGDHGHEVLGRAAGELHDRVSSKTDSELRLDAIQDWVRAQADRRRMPVRPELIRAWQLVETSAGRCRVEDVARDVALSPRQLRALMGAEIGLSPKQLCRSFRFDHVIAQLAGGRRNLAEVAALTGYADQSHLTREFQQMAGCTPSHWLVEERRNIQDGGHTNRPDSDA